MRPSHAIAFALLAAGLRRRGATAAESWPTRPLTMVVPFAAGGGTDVMGRIVGRRLSEVLGQQVIIENVGGAGGMVGSARVAKAAPDGYQFVLGSAHRCHQPDALQEPALQSRPPISRRSC